MKQPIIEQATATDNENLLNLYEEEKKDKTVLIKTVQSSAFRVLVEALKDILQDVNIHLDQTGIKVITMDVSQTVLVHLKLEAKHFEYYFCEKDTVIGINLGNLFKLIKSMSNNDTLTLSISKSSSTIACITQNTAGSWPMALTGAMAQTTLGHLMKRLKGNHHMKNQCSLSLHRTPPRKAWLPTIPLTEMQRMRQVTDMMERWLAPS